MNADYKKLLSNFSYLSLFQLISIGAPFLTYPYIIAVYGDVTYGKISWAKASIQFFIILVNFGFDLSATRNIANNINNPKKIGEIVSTVYSVKFLLTLVGIAILIGLTLVSETAKNESLLLYLTFGWVMGELLIPLWYFQGVEKMKMITYVNGGVRIASAIFILLIINKSLHYSTVPLIELVFILLGGIVAVYYVLKKERVHLVIPSLKMLKTAFKESIGLFFSRGMFVIIDKFNIIVIQYFLGFKEVAIFDIASKITHLMRVPFLVVNQSIYPYLNQSKNMQLVKQLIKIALITVIVFCVIVGFSSEYILGLIFPKYDEIAVIVLYIFLVRVPFSVLSYFLGSSTLLVNGFFKEFNRSVIYAGFAYFFLLGILYLTSSLNLIMLSVMLILVELVMVLYRYHFVNKNNLL